MRKSRLYPLALAAFALGAFALASCGGGGSHSAGTVPTTGGSPSGSSGSSGSSGPDLSAKAPHNAAAAAGAVAANVSVSVPLTNQTNSQGRKALELRFTRGIKTLSQTRKPTYLTSYTAGIDLQAYQNGTYSGYVFYPLGTGEPDCAVVGSTLNCSLSVQAPPGSTTIIVHTYDSTGFDEDTQEPTGNMLSVAAPTFTIAGGKTNNITVTTLPIAAYFDSAVSPPACFVVGAPDTINTTYTAYDADNGPLTGLTLANTLSLSNLNTSDATAGFAVTPSTITSGSGPITFSYNGSDTNLGVFGLTSSLTPSGATNAQVGVTGVLPLTTAGPHYVYVTDSTNDQIDAFDICASNDAVVPITTYSLPASPLKIKFDRYQSTPSDPRVFVMTSSEVLYVDIGNSTANGAADVLASPAPGGTLTSIQDSSSSGALFVTGGSYLKKYTTSTSTPYLTLAGTNSSAFTAPAHIGLEGTGNDAFVADPGKGFVAAVDTTNALPVNQSVEPSDTPNFVSGPNSDTSCALATDSTAGTVAGINVVTAGATSGLTTLGSSSFSGVEGAFFFPPAITGSGTEGYGSTTALAIAPGEALIVTCADGSFSPVTTWTPFMAAPTRGGSPSNYASTVVPGLVYLVGTDDNPALNGGSPSTIPIFEAYSQYANTPLFWVDSPSSGTLTAVTSGP